MMQTSNGITSFQVSAFLFSFALGDLVGLSKAFIRMQWKAKSVCYHYERWKTMRLVILKFKNMATDPGQSMTRPWRSQLFRCPALQFAAPGYHGGAQCLNGEISMGNFRGSGYGNLVLGISWGISWKSSWEDLHGNFPNHGNFMEIISWTETFELCHGFSELVWCLDGATTPTMTKCASRQCWRTKGIAWQLKKKGRKRWIHCSSKRLNIVSIDLNRFDTRLYNIMIARQSYWLLFSCSNQIKPGHFTCKVS